MKVLHLISGGDKGGAKTHVFTLLMALAEEIDVTVACVMDGVFYQEIQYMPIKSILFKQKYRKDLTVLKPIIKHIRENRYHLIHAHGARANFIVMFLKMFIKTPFLTTVHSDYRLDFSDNMYKKYIYTGLNIVSLKFLDYYIAVSDNFKDMLVNRGFEKKDIYTVYNTIDFEKDVDYISKSNFINRYSIDETDNIVGIIGRFDQVKGHKVFIDAAAHVLEKHPNTKFLLAGEGPEEQNLKQQAKKLKIENNIIFTGFIDDIFSFINCIDINVLTSYSESFPYVLLEGALMKKATVSTAVGGVIDLIKENETGLLATAGDAQSVAEKINKIISNKDLAKNLGSNLYDYAKERFSKESMKRRHIEIYTDILSRMKKDNKIFDVVLSGYYGFDNSGDDALLKAVIDSLRKEKKDIKILVLSKKPMDTINEHNVYSVNRHNIFAIKEYFKRCRVFIYGGGSLIQDITSTKSLIYYIMLLETAKKYGMKLMVYGNGIGPITKKSNVNRAREALAICDYVSLREPESLEELERIGVSKENAVLSVDPAFSIDYVENIEIFNTEGIDKNKSYFAINLRVWRYNEPCFTKKIADIINYVAKKYNLIPICIAMHPSDYIIIKEVIKEANIKEHVILSKVYDVATLMGIIKQTKFVMSMRLHTLVYAVSVGVPVVGLSYDPKIDAFLNYIEQKTCVSTSYIDIQKLSDIIDNIFDDYEAVRIKIKDRSSYLKKLSENDAKAAISLL